MPRENEEIEIDLVEFLYRILAKWKLFVLMMLVFSVGAGVYTKWFVTPQYQATATIYVVRPSDSAINVADLQLGSALTKDYIKIFQMWEVHELVIDSLDLPYSYGKMRNMLSVENINGTRMLDLTVTSSSPEEAAAIANEYARVGSEYIAETMSTDKPNIMSVALVPANPVSPNMTRNIMTGLLLGFLLSCGIIAGIYILDDKYRTAEDVRKYTGLVTLAIIPIEEKNTAKEGKNNHKRIAGKKKGGRAA